MVLNTKEKSARIKLATMFFVILYLILLVASLFFKWSPSHIFELIITIVFVDIMIFIFIKNYTYVYYNSDGPKIIVRFTSLQPLTAGNFSVEITKRDFVKYEIIKKFFGLRKELILYVRTTKGIAKFKPISLSVLNKKELNFLIEDLNSFQTIKK